jgi:Tfp pilus assembly protein PilO
MTAAVFQLMSVLLSSDFGLSENLTELGKENPLMAIVIGMLLLGMLGLIIVFRIYWKASRKDKKDCERERIEERNKYEVQLKEINRVLMENMKSELNMLNQVHEILKGFEHRDEINALKTEQQLSNMLRAIRNKNEE